MAFVFFSMFLLSLPAIFSNYYGTALHDNDDFYGILKTTLGN